MCVRRYGAHRCYGIKSYILYYNHGDIKKNDGVVVYVRENVLHTIETIVIDKRKLLQHFYYIKNNRKLTSIINVQIAWVELYTI